MSIWFIISVLGWRCQGKQLQASPTATIGAIQSVSYIHCHCCDLYNNGTSTLFKPPLRTTIGSGTNSISLLILLWFLLFLSGHLQKSLRLCRFKSNRDEIWQDCYPSQSASLDGVQNIITSPKVSIANECCDATGCSLWAQVSLVMFGTYVYLGAPAGTQNSLPPAVTFVCLSLICLLNYNVSTLPSSFNYINQVRIFLVFIRHFSQSKMAW